METEQQRVDGDQNLMLCQDNVYGLAKHQVASRLAAGSMHRLPLTERIRHPDEEREKQKALIRKQQKQLERQRLLEKELEEEPGFLAAKLGGVLNKSLVEQEAQRKKQIEEEDGHWAYDHPSRVRLRLLNHEVCDLLISEAKKRSEFYD